MINIKSIVITGGYEGNPSKFVTQLEPTKVSENTEIAVSSIFHGEVFNMREGNNKLHVARIDIDDEIHMANPLGVGDTNEIAKRVFSKYRHLLQTVTIPPGYYPSSFVLCLKIEEIIVDTLNIPKRSFTVTIDKHRGILQIRMTGVYIENREDSPWGMLRVQGDLFHVHELPNLVYENEQIPGFLYMDIVENSYINGKLSRNLTVAPLKMSSVWNYYEFTNPRFTSINVHEFSKILVELRDVTGEYVPFNPAYKTILTLCIRSSPLYK